MQGYEFIKALKEIDIEELRMLHRTCVERIKEHSNSTEKQILSAAFLLADELATQHIFKDDNPLTEIDLVGILGG